MSGSSKKVVYAALAGNTLIAITKVERLNEVLIMHMGPDFILANLSVDFHDAIAAGDLESLIAGLDATIKQQFPAVKRVFIEAEARKTCQ